MAYYQKPGRGNSNPIMKLSDKLKEGSGLKLLGDLDKDGTLNKYEATRQATIEKNTSPATMYGAPVKMRLNNSSLPQSGINYGSPADNEKKKPRTRIEGDDDRYTYEVPIKGSTKKISRKAAREMAGKMYAAAQQGYGTSGYMRGGSDKLEIGKGRLINFKRVRGGGSELELTSPEQNLDLQNISKRDIRRTIMREGAATITPEGGLTGGTTQTRSKIGRVSADLKKQEIQQKRAEQQAKRQSSIEAREKAAAERKAMIQQRRAELEAKRQERINAQKRS